MKIRKNDEQYLKSVIKRMKNQNKTKFGIKTPWNVKEALLIDKFNKNIKLADAIAKEMEALFFCHPIVISVKKMNGNM